MEKNRNENKTFDQLAETPAFYVFLGVCLLAVLLTVLMLAIAGGKPIKTTDEITLKNVNEGNYSEAESGELSDYFQGYKNFISHDDYVETGASERPNVTEKPEGTADIAATNEIEETKMPEETPSATETEAALPTQSNGRIVYDLKTRYAAAQNTTIDSLTESIKVGDILIENLYGAEGFDLMEVLGTELTVQKSEKLDWPRIVLYSTFAGEGYCTTVGDKKIGISTDGYGTAACITERAKVLEAAAEKLGVGVARTADVCDTDPLTAYEKSSAVATHLAKICTTCELSIDLQRVAFEYPEGTKYGPYVTKDGKKYAMVKIVVSQDEETNGNWRENVKFAVLLIERLEEKMPGISLGIELQADGKYNTTATKYGLLIELGYEGNLIEEADNTAALLGETLAEIYLGK